MSELTALSLPEGVDLARETDSHGSRSVTKRTPRWRNSSGYFLCAGMIPPSRWIAASTRPGAAHFSASSEP